ncbi:MAG: LamG-like jellyroll fold domain-containing protein [Planctomycetaceae bacterium]
MKSLLKTFSHVLRTTFIYDQRLCRKRKLRREVSPRIDWLEQRKLLTGVYESTVLADSPTAFWRLGDPAVVPPISDSSGNSVSGTPLNGISLGQTGALTGDSSTAARFSSSGDGVLIDDRDSLSPGVAATFELWIRPDAASTGQYQNLLSKFDYAQGRGFEYELLISPSGQLYFGRSGSALSSVAVTSGVWQHVAVTLNNGSVSFFINGVARGVGSVAASGLNTTAPVQIGTSQNTPYQFFGAIDEVATYSTALTPSQILSHYQSAANGTYATSVLANSPVAYWRLGDPPSVADRSGNSLSGSRLGGTFAQPGALADDSNTSVRFSTSGQGILVPDNPLLTPGTSATFEAWVKPDFVATGAYQNLLSKYSYTGLGTEYELLISPTGQFYFGKSGGGVLVSAAPAVAGAWQHVAVTVNNGNVAFYINGVVGGMGTVASGFVNSAAPIQIGTTSNRPYQFNGQIDEIAIYSTALSATRILAHYKAGTNFIPTNIQLSSDHVAENNAAGTTVGTINTVDTIGDTFSYALISGDGDSDNSKFQISGNQLLTSEPFDYETRSSYSIRVRSTDQGQLSFEKSLTVNVTDVDEISPTVLTTSFLSSGTLAVGSTTLAVTFSEPVTGADLPGNYELRRAGTDGLLLSSDVPTNPTNVSVVGNVATLTFPEMAEDTWRLNVRDSISDAAGNGLDGNGSTVAEGDWRRDFVASERTALDPSFGVAGRSTTEFFANSPASEKARALAIQPDGRFVVAGEAGYLVRYLPDGQLDTSFGEASNGRAFFGGTATAIAIQSDGKIVVAGYAAAAGGYDDFMVCRYFPNGLFDTSFSDDGTVLTPIGSHHDRARGIAIQPDGAVVVAGESILGSTSDTVVVRYTSSGILDPTFDGDGIRLLALSTGNDAANAVALQADGKIVIAGINTVGFSPDFSVTRFNSNGTLDTSFDGDGTQTTSVTASTDVANAIVIQPDGKILLAGHAVFDFALVRYNTNGSLDTTWDTDGIQTTTFGTSSETAYGVALHADGKILVAGSAVISGSSDFAFARYNGNGSLDATFGTAGKQTVSFGSIEDIAYGVALQTDGKAVAVGTMHNGSYYDVAVARLAFNGTPDASFDADGKVIDTQGLSSESISNLSVLPNGTIVASGVLSASDGGTNFAIARYDLNGRLDATFDTDGRVVTDFGATTLSTDIANDQTIQSDGKIIVAGYTSIGGNVDFALARYNINGSLDTTFDGDGRVLTSFGASDYARGVRVQSDGKIVAGGYTTLSGNTDFALARYNSNGSLDTTFGSSGRVYTAFGSSADVVDHIEIQSDGKILAIGHTNNGSNDDFAVARYLPNGTLDTSFDGDGKVSLSFGAFADYAGATAIQSDGKILIAGRSSNSSGYTDVAVARLNADGSLDTNFDGDGKTVLSYSATTNTTISDELASVLVQSDGRILLVGLMQNGGLRSLGIIRLDSNGLLDNSFDDDGKLTTSLATSSVGVGSAALQNDGKLVVGGSVSFGNNGDFAVLRYSSSGESEFIASNGSTFDVDTYGNGTAQLIEGPLGAFDGFDRLTVNGNHFAPLDGITATNDAGQTLLTGTSPISGVQIRREVTIPQAGSIEFARISNSFLNPNANAISLPLRFSGNLGSDAGTTVFATSDGDLLVEPTDLWFGTDDADGTGTPAIVHLLHGPFGLRPSTVNVIEDNVEWTYDLTIPAGETKRLASFTVLGTTRAEAIAAANVLVTNTAFGGEAAAYLTADEMASLANFEFNSAPTSIAITAHSIVENAAPNASVGTLNFTDLNAGDTGSFSLPAGLGDNALFNIAPDGTTLQAKLPFDYELKNSYSLIVRVTDAGGLSVDETFQINVTNANESPTNITLQGTTVDENLPSGTDIGTFSTIDPDFESTFSYEIVPVSGSSDHESFTIFGGTLKTTAAFDFESKSNYSIRIRSTDLGGLAYEKDFLISVTDIEEDATTPVSTIAALPSTSTSLLINISPSGADPGAGASGVKDYDLYYSTGGSFNKFATVPASSPSTTFMGSANTTYWFRSLARDNAGNEETKTSADTFTRIGDVVPPATQVTSAVPNSNGLFSVQMTGTKVGGTALTAFDAYVSIDSNTPVLIGSASGVSLGSGNYSSQILFQGTLDGASHTYRFFSVGRDGSGNVETAPVSGDVSVTYSFASAGLTATAIDVQNGVNQRSFVRYLDVLFSSSTGLNAMLNADRVKVERFAIDAASVTPGTGVDSPGAVLSQNGNRLRLDFGANGLGGLRQSGNGFYRVLLDLDGNSSFADAGDAAFEFHRLFGDANGDAKVDVADTNLVTSQIGRTGSNQDGDLDGNNAVNSTDRLYTTQQRGKKLLDPMLSWLDD